MLLRYFLEFLFAYVAYILLSTHFGSFAFYACLAYCLVRVARVLSSFRVLDVSGKSVLITGCDTGFGRMCAIRLSKGLGVRVFAGCLTPKGRDELNHLNMPMLFPLMLDVTKQESVLQALEVIEKECPKGLWAVINNAGIFRPAALGISSIEDWRLSFDVNVLGIVYVTKACLPLLRKAKGRVINIASVAGLTAVPGQSCYSGTKFAVEGLSDSLRRELTSEGVSVVIIEPGVMKTDLYDHMSSKATMDRTWASLNPEQQEYYGRKYIDEVPQHLSKITGQINGNPETVVDALKHIVESSWPLPRYTIGKDTFLWWISSILPSYVGDGIFKLLAGKGIKPAASIQ